jgi:uncharacterized membrane protein
MINNLIKGDLLEDRQRIKIIASIDISVSIILIILGCCLLFYYGAVSENISGIVDLNEKLANDYKMENPFKWMEGLPLLLIFLGLIALIYGVERLLNNILKLIIAKKPQIKQLNIQTYPIEPPEIYQR